MKTKLIIKEEVIGFKDFRLNAAKYIDAANEGQSFLVVKRSRPVFRIEPVGEVWETIGDFTTMPNGGVSAKELAKALRESL
jgi:prevent-host-death family protein